MTHLYFFPMQPLDRMHIGVVHTCVHSIVRMTQHEFSAYLKVHGDTALFNLKFFLAVLWLHIQYSQFELGSIRMGYI